MTTGVEAINAAGWGVYSATQFDQFGKCWAVLIRPFDIKVELIGRGLGWTLDEAVEEAWHNREEGTIKHSYSMEPPKKKINLVAALGLNRTVSGSKPMRRL